MKNQKSNSTTALQNGNQSNEKLRSSYMLSSQLMKLFEEGSCFFVYGLKKAATLLEATSEEEKVADQSYQR